METPHKLLQSFLAFKCFNVSRVGNGGVAVARYVHVSCEEEAESNELIKEQLQLHVVCVALSTWWEGEGRRWAD